MSSVSTTGSVSSLGIGSGLDVTSIISGLMKVEQAPLTDLQNKATSIQATITAFGTVTSDMSTFRDAAASMSLPSTWNATTSTSANPSAVGVTSSATAAAGNYAVAVQSLAAAQSTVSSTFSSSSSLVGAGTLHFDLGSWNSDNSAFTAATGSTGVDVAVTASDTLDTLAAKVNATKSGVTAAVVTDNTGARLVFSSQTTGLSNAFRVTGTGGGTALAYDPANGSTGSTLTQAASDAKATINGLSVSSSTNSLTNVLNGLTLSLNQVTTAGSPVQVQVAQDTAGITKSVQSFVDSYNALSTLLTTDLAYNASTKVAGPLQADSSAVSLQRQLRNIIGSPSGASSVFTTLSQVGLQVQADGTLQLDSTALNSAMSSNPDALKALFTNVDLTTPSNNGIANQLRTFGDSVLGYSGLLTARVSGLNTTLASNQTDQDNLQTRLAATQARLQAQYSALDTKMASISTLSTYVTQQIANWNKST